MFNGVVTEGDTSDGGIVYKKTYFPPGVAHGHVRRRSRAAAAYSEDESACTTDGGNPSSSSSSDGDGRGGLVAGQVTGTGPRHARRRSSGGGRGGKGGLPSAKRGAATSAAAVALDSGVVVTRSPEAHAFAGTGAVTCVTSPATRRGGLRGLPTTLLSGSPGGPGGSPLRPAGLVATRVATAVVHRSSPLANPAPLPPSEAHDELAGAGGAPAPAAAAAVRPRRRSLLGGDGDGPGADISPGMPADPLSPQGSAASAAPTATAPIATAPTATAPATTPRRRGDGASKTPTGAGTRLGLTVPSPSMPTASPLRRVVPPAPPAVGSPHSRAGAARLSSAAPVTAGGSGDSDGDKAQAQPGGRGTAHGGSRSAPSTPRRAGAAGGTAAGGTAAVVRTGAAKGASPAPAPASEWL